jgi:hypothetical protein
MKLKVVFAALALSAIGSLPAHAAVVLTLTDALGNILPGNVLTIPANSYAELYGTITNTDPSNQIIIDSDGQTGAYVTPTGGASTLFSYGPDNLLDNVLPLTIDPGATTPVESLITINTGPDIGTAYGYESVTDSVDEFTSAPLFQINTVPEPGALTLLSCSALAGTALVGIKRRRR